MIFGIKWCRNAGASERIQFAIAVAIDFRFIKINQYTKCSYSKIVYGFYRILKSTCEHHWQLGNLTTTQIMHFRGHTMHCIALQWRSEGVNAYAKFQINVSLFLNETATWTLLVYALGILCWHRRNEVNQPTKIQPYENRARMSSFLKRDSTEWPFNFCNTFNNCISATMGLIKCTIIWTVNSVYETPQ